MDKLEPLLSPNEFQNLIKKSTFTQRDVALLASCTKQSLLSNLSGLSSSEANEVYSLEAKNMYFLLTACMVSLGKDLDGLNRITSLYSSELIALFEVLGEKSNNVIENKKNMFIGLSCFILANGNVRNFTPKFVGKVPGALFSFRQASANSWFNETANFYIGVTGEVIAKGGNDLALNYILSAIAWYLNESQPFKYYEKSSDMHLGDTIANILIDFINSVNGSQAYIKSVDIAPLYKDL